ncbi:DNA-binding SARP family transcriptional activator [Kitasatospora sp. GAS204A]|uniref:AfsR/SARP family transcriptional regulator n=1 Tax=unclassified Kitasatospora TaxID=2633591 RepID=UPI0024748E38|nr:BTAD domain-containing putative transcriptional regulator [Kitasatospora sp. GAS204B]MDH6119209.1 DNA-binding SARP family transcriptional activator [Kitasatospora sp. GAS204B]
MRFTVLGPPRVWSGDVELELGPPKQRALLALLLVHAGQPVEFSEIVDVLWGEEPPHSAANVVHRHVGALRKLLEPRPASGEHGSPVLRSSGTYRLPVDPESLDLAHFRALVERAHRARAAGTPAAAVELLTQALALRHGVTAAGIPAQVRAHPAFTSIDREYLGVVRNAAQVALEAGRAGRILPALQDAAERNPLEEGLQAHLMKALAVTGQQAEALEVYRRVRSQLAEQLGVDPGPELLDAHRQVLHGAPPARATAPGQTAPGHTSPEHTADAAAGPAGGPAPVDAPSPAAPATRPAQLPAALAGFTGRSAELALLQALLPGQVENGRLENGQAASGRPGTVVISAINGMAGVGKTTLAVHLAHRIADRFPDGQLYANLRGFDPAGLVPSVSEVLRGFLHALGEPPQRVPAGADEQAALYRSLLAGRRMLIMLDNARSPQQVRPLLPGAPGSLVIVTSRDQLHGLIASEGAHPLSLGPFSPEEARDALVQRLGAARVAAEPQAVELIIELCGRLPLALAVVAARAATRPEFPLASIAAELRSSHGSLDAFTGTDPSTDVRTVFSWSCELLTPEARQLFRLLALHPGPDFTVPAAANLAGLPAGRAATLLDELGQAHLVTAPTPGRYALHDLLHAHARELSLAYDDERTRQAALRRMTDYYLHSAHAAATLLAPHRLDGIDLPAHGSGTAAETLDGRPRAAAWLDAELPVLLRLIEQASANGLPTHAWQLAQTLAGYLDRRGHWQDQLRIQRTALQAADRAADVLGQAHAHRELGFACGRLSRESDAQHHLERSLTLFTELGDRDGQARTHRHLAFRANSRLDYDQALRHYEQACAHYQATGRLSGQGSVLNETGWTHILLGQHEQALALCRRAIDLHRRIDDLNGEAAAWDSLGYAQHHLRQYAQALTSYERALNAYQALNDSALEADTLSHIGDTLDAQGKHESAVVAWEQALAILDELGHPDAEQLRRRIRERATE